MLLLRSILFYMGHYAVRVILFVIATYTVLSFTLLLLHESGHMISGIILGSIHSTVTVTSHGVSYVSSLYDKPIDTDITNISGPLLEIVSLCIITIFSIWKVRQHRILVLYLLIVYLFYIAGSIDLWRSEIFHEISYVSTVAERYSSVETTIGSSDIGTVSQPQEIPSGIVSSVSTGILKIEPFPYIVITISMALLTAVYLNYIQPKLLRSLL